VQLFTDKNYFFLKIPSYQSAEEGKSHAKSKQENELQQLQIKTEGGRWSFFVLALNISKSFHGSKML